VTITGKVTLPADAVAGGTTLVVTVNGVPTTATVHPDGTWEAQVQGSDLASDPDSTVDAKLTVTDAAGNSGVTDVAKPYTIDTQAPTQTIQITSVTTDTGVSSTDFITNDGTLVFGGTVSSALGVGEKVQVSLDNGATWHDATANGLSWSWDNTATTLAPADYTITARVVDTAGNIGNNATHALTIDVTPPSTSGITITIEDITADNTINAAEAASPVTIKGTASGLPADAVTQTLVVTVNNVDYTATVTGTGPNVTWTVNVPGSALVADTDRTVQATLTVTDTAGNSDHASADHLYSVDATPPTIAITTTPPIAGDGLISPSEAPSVALSGTTTGVEDNQVVTVTITDAANHTVTATAVVTGNAWTLPGVGIDVSSLDDGTLTIKADVTDKAGNPASGTAQVAMDTAAPTQTIDITSVTTDTGASASDFVTSDQTLTFNGTIGAPLGAGEKVQVSIDGGATWNDAVTPPNGTS
jgi:hypothetical protein